MSTLEGEKVDNVVFFVIIEEKLFEIQRTRGDFYEEI